MPSTMTDLKGKGKEGAVPSPVTAISLPSSSSTKQTSAVVEEDDDDDLDELDDVLNQFNTAPPASTSAKDTHDRNGGIAVSNTADKGTNNDEDNEDDDDDDEDDFEAIFAAELAKEMEKMMGGGANKNSASSASDQKQKAGPPPPSTIPGLGEDSAAKDDLLNDKELQDAFEKIMASAKAGGMGAGDADLSDDGDINFEELSKLMKGLGGGAGAGGIPDLEALLGGAAAAGGSSSSAKPSTSSTSNKQANKTANGQKQAKPQNFEDTIQATMSRLASSEAQHKSRTAKGKKEAEDPLAALMAQMEAMGGGAGLGGLPGAGGEGDEENLPELLDGLMDQLMSKELLFEPITELKQKYPEYLTSSEAASLPTDERQRYEKQESIVKEIYIIFDDPKYTDENKETREKIANLMQAMQECGAPPKHLMGELGPAMALGADGMPNIDPDNCIIS